MHTKLPQLRANKSPLLQVYLHTANSETYMSHCLTHTHDTNTSLTVVNYKQNITPSVCGKKLLEAAEVIKKWESRLDSLKGEEMATLRYPWRRGNNNNNKNDII